MHSFLNQKNAQLWIFFFLSFYKSFCFQYFHINLSALDLDRSQKRGQTMALQWGVERGFTIEGDLSDAREVREPLCLSKPVSLPEWRGRASQCTSVSQLG